METNYTASPNHIHSNGSSLDIRMFLHMGRDLTGEQVVVPCSVLPILMLTLSYKGELEVHTLPFLNFLKWHEGDNSILYARNQEPRASEHSLTWRLKSVSKQTPGLQPRVGISSYLSVQPARAGLDP